MLKKIVISTLILSMLLTGCARTPSQTESTENNTTENITQEVEITKETAYKNTSKMIDLLSESSGNIVVSDMSINMALSMALEGANGSTKEELERYLGKDVATNNMYNKEILESLSKYKNTKYEIANSFWYNNTLKVNKDYAKLLEKDYQAETKQVNMTDGKTADEINKWCKDKTHDLIPKIVSPETIATQESVLINALYFKANWVNEFYKGATQKETFKGLDGDTEVDMMHSIEDTYLENETATGFMKYYKEGFAFVGILPKTEGDFSVLDMDIKNLVDSKTTDYDVNIGLPKFKVEYSTSLVNSLKKMGITNSFDKDNADFSGIADDLYISDIIHKTYISVDEIGTEAAAVTAIIMEATSAIPEPKEVKDVILDRPFAFAIINTETGDILFTGKITNI